MEEIDNDTSKIHVISTEVADPSNKLEDAMNSSSNLNDESLETSSIEIA